MKMKFNTLVWTLVVFILLVSTINAVNLMVPTISSSNGLDNGSLTCSSTLFQATAPTNTINATVYWYLWGSLNQSIEYLNDYPDMHLGFSSVLPSDYLYPNQNWTCSIMVNDSVETKTGSAAGFVILGHSISFSSFGGDTTNFSSYNKTERLNITKATIHKPNAGKIAWNNGINVLNADFDSNIQIGQNYIYVNSTNLHNSTNSSANLTLENLGYANPIPLLNGEVCDSCTIISYANGNLTFNVSHFSNYTSAENASLFINDTSDAVTIQKHSNVYFYANYSNQTSGEPVLNANCQISHNSPGAYTAWSPMTYNAGSGLYEYNETIHYGGNFLFNVTCAAADFVPLNLTDSLYLTYTGPLLVDPFINTSNGTNTEIDTVNCGTVLSNTHDEPMNVTITWYVNGSSVATDNYFNSYPNGTMFSGSLAQSYVSLGANISCELQAFDHNDAGLNFSSETIEIVSGVLTYLRKNAVPDQVHYFREASMENLTYNSYLKAVVMKDGKLKGKYLSENYSFGAAYNLTYIEFKTAPSGNIVSGTTEHSCAILENNTALCWGKGYLGALGDGDTSSHTETSPVTVSSGIMFKSITTGNAHTCGIALNGTAFCWGEGGNHQLGTGVAGNSGVPLPINSSEEFIELSAGMQHTCGISKRGIAYCWGYCEDGRCGDNDTSIHEVSSPLEVITDVKFNRISSGDDYTCAIARNNSAYCWGNGDYAKLGDRAGGSHDVGLATQVNSSIQFKEISSSLSDHTCGIALNGTAFCWGWSENGFLGVGVGGFAVVDAPLPVDSSEKFSKISAGQKHTCALTINGTAYCWGEGASGKLGDGYSQNRDAPTLVNLSETITDISAAASHTCAVLSNKSTFCWGEGVNGKLGTGSTNTEANPLTVNNANPFASINSTMGLRYKYDSWSEWKDYYSSEVIGGLASEVQFNFELDPRRSGIQEVVIHYAEPFFEPPTVSGLGINSTDDSNMSLIDLNCFGTLHDGDNDFINVTVNWYLNGSLNFTENYPNSYAPGTFFSSTLDANNISHKDNWSCALTTYDMWNTSTYHTPNNLTILAIPYKYPNVTNLNLVSQNKLNLTTHDLICSAYLEDNEGHDINVTVNWYKNNQLNQTINYHNNYPNGTQFSQILYYENTSVGDNWSCAIQAFDNYNISSWHMSSNVAILPTPVSCVDVSTKESDYVDQDSLCGRCNDAISDSNITNPYCSIEKGIQELNISEQLIIKSGIYRLPNITGTTSFIMADGSVNGTAGNKTIIMGYPGEYPKIYLSQNISGWQLHGGSIWKVNLSQQVSSSYIASDYKPQMVVVDTNSNSPIKLQQVNSLANTQCSSSRLPNLRTNESDMIAGDFYYDNTTTTLYVWLPDSSDPNSQVMEVGLMSFVRIDQAENIEVSNLEFRYSGSENIQCPWPLMHVMDSSNITINYNRFKFADSIALGGMCKDCVVENNVFNYSGNSAIGLRGNYTSIHQNFIYNSNWRMYNETDHAGGMKLIPGQSFMTITSNLVQDTLGSGIWLDNMGLGNRISKNRIYNSSRHGIFIEITNSTNANPTYVDNNIVSSCGVRGVYVSASLNTQVLHNNIFNCSEGISFGGIPRENYQLRNNSAINNIIYDCDTAASKVNDSINASQNVFNYNIYYDSNSTPNNDKFNIWSEPISYSNLSDWVLYTGHDMNSFEEDPGIKNFTTYELANDSIAVEGGFNAAMNEDYYGKQRPLGNVNDIGIYEFVIIAFPPVISLVNVTAPDGYNSTNSNLSCNGYVTDVDNHKTNVTVSWYKNNALQFNVQEFNSYPNGSIISSVLDMGNTTVGDNWSCSMIATDIFNQSIANYSGNITVLEDIRLYLPPYLNNLQLNTYDGYNSTNSDLRCSFYLNDTENHRSNITINWYMNGTLDQTILYSNSYLANQNLNFTLNMSNTTVGENWTCGVVLNDSYNISSEYLSSNLTVLEDIRLYLAPVASPIQFNSLTSLNNSDADFECNTTITDEENHSINVTLNWYLNGALNKSINLNNNYENNTFLRAYLNSSNTSYLQNWSCGFILSDNYNISGVYMSENITIAPNPPVASQLSYLSDDGYNSTNSDLTCSVQVADIDNHTMNLTFEWYKNGALNQTHSLNNNYPNGSTIAHTLGMANTTVGENWSCNAFATDAYNVSNTLVSSNITILEDIRLYLAPVISNLIINSSDGSNSTNSNLTCYGSISDTEGHNANATVNWYLNGSLDQTTNYFNSYPNATQFSASLLSDNTSIDDRWSCGIVLSDNYNISSEFRSENITVLFDINENYVPNAQNFTLVSLDGYDSFNSDLNCSANLTDLNIHRINATFRWYEGGALNETIVFNNSYPSDTVFSVIKPAADVTLGDNWTCSLVLSDVFNSSNEYFSNNLIIVDDIRLYNPPYINSLVFNTTSVLNTTSDNLTCYADLNDIENHTINTTVNWYRNGTLYTTNNYHNSYSNGTYFSAELSSSNLEWKDKWSCGIVLSDNYNVSSEYMSSNISIQFDVTKNNLPTTSGLNLVSNDGFNSTGTNLTCSATLVDNDRQNINATVYWYEDSILQLTESYHNNYLNNTLFTAQLGFSNTSMGENWTCQVELFDGFNSTNSTVSNNVFIVYDVRLYSKPTITNLILTFDDSMNSTFSNLLCNSTLNDVDTHNMNVTVGWYLNNSIYRTDYYNNSYAAGSDFSAQLSYMNTTVGENWTCEVFVSDSYNESINYTSGSLSVLELIRLENHTYNNMSFDSVNISWETNIPVNFTFNVSNWSPLVLVNNSNATHTNYTWQRFNSSYDFNSTSYKASHSVMLWNLSPSTEYNYSLSLCDDKSNCTVKNFSFTTNQYYITIEFNTSAWDNSTNNLSQYINETSAVNVTNLTFSNGNGSVRYEQDIVINRSLDLKDQVIIANNYVFINSTYAFELNRPATIILYGITFSSPQILKDGAVCSSPECVQVSYSNSTFVFNVTGFSEYSIRQTPTPPSSGGSSGGSSRRSSGGGGSITLPVKEENETEGPTLFIPVLGNLPKNNTENVPEENIAEIPTVESPGSVVHNITLPIATAFDGLMTQLMDGEVWNYLWVLILASLVFLAISSVPYAILQNKKENKKVMVLKESILGELEYGYTIDEIKQKSLATGYTLEELDEAIPYCIELFNSSFSTEKKLGVWVLRKLRDGMSLEYIRTMARSMNLPEKRREEIIQKYIQIYKNQSSP